MQSRSLMIGIAAALCASAVWAQTPTPTLIDSNIAVTAYAQERGQSVLNGTPVACTPTSRGGTACGGCYPDGLPPSGAIQAAVAQLPKVNPEWEVIGPMIQPPDPAADLSQPPAANLVFVNGVIGLSKSPGDDFPGSHITPDYNAEIIPDIHSRLGTGNTNQRVEFEWEGDKFPLYMWAGEGDRVIALGRWIFDCGHPDPGPLGACSGDANAQCITNADCTGTTGTCSGGHCFNDAAVVCSSDSQCNFGTCTNPAPEFAYQSEMHPPQSVVMLRDKSLPAPHAGRTAPAIPATRADVFISGDGGGAGDRCTVTHLHNDSDVLFAKSCFLNHCSVTTERSCRADSDCAGGETCITLDPANRLADINGSNFEFDMPLPPPPSVGTATLKITTKSYKPKGGLMPKATFQPTLGSTPNLHVIVPMATPLPSGKMPNVFAQSISAGWKEDTTSLTHVQVKFKKLTVTNPVKDDTPVVSRQCANAIAPYGPGGLTGTVCTTDADCAAGTCATNFSKACHTDKDCSKKDYCTNGQRCIGGVTPGWRLWAEVNGDWIQFKKLETMGTKAPFAAPPYFVPSPTPLAIAEAFSFNEFVPAGGSIHIKASGRTDNCLNTLFGGNLMDGLHQYGLSTGATCLNAGSHDPGTIDLMHTDLTPSGLTTTTGSTVTCSTTGSLTTCQAKSEGGDGGHCSTTANQLCVTDADCPGSETCTVTSEAYTLEYTIKVIP
jgi:hypothetical protein